jgi:hypothetical protein
MAWKQGRSKGDKVKKFLVFLTLFAFLVGADSARPGNAGGE